MRHLSRALVVFFLFALTTPAHAAWEKVPPVDWSKLKPTDFKDDELDLPFYLEHFHTVANGVVEDGPDRGFINVIVWRGARDNKPYNARVMENHLALAYFYCTDRPWNVYYKSPAVRARLEAVLEFWCNMQSDDGQFSEYGPKQWNLPATAFSTKFMGQTLTLLSAKNAPPIDAALLKRVDAADRKAIVATLTIPDLYTHGKEYTNQYCNVFAGAPAYLALHPEEKEIGPLLEKVMRRAADDFISPCGFFYERNGCDFGYTLHTTFSDFLMAYHYERGTPLGALIEMEEAKWADWLSYNLLREPDGSTFVINRGIESRQLHADWPRSSPPMAEHVELARAFGTSVEEQAANATKARAELEASWGKFPALSHSGSHDYEPYAFVHRDHYQWIPTEAQRQAAIATLPYLAKDSFTHQRSDSREPLVCTFIRRPTYYAIVNAGTMRSDQQRYGQGLLWSPLAGTIIQTQTASDLASWGTSGRTDGVTYESGPIDASFTVAGEKVKVAPGIHDLPRGDVVVTYPLGTIGEKSITYTDAGIAVAIKHPGNMVEHVPILLKGTRNDVHVENGKATVQYDKVTLEITFDGRAMPRSTQLNVAGKQIVTLELASSDAMKYEIKIVPK